MALTYSILKCRCRFWERFPLFFRPMTCEINEFNQGSITADIHKHCMAAATILQLEVPLSEHRSSPSPELAAIYGACLVKSSTKNRLHVKHRGTLPQP
jgi:hypothetical protein